MDPLRAQLLDKVAELACELSSAQARALALEVEASRSPKRVRRVAGLPAPQAVLELCDLWERVGGISGGRLGDAIRSAAKAVETATGYEKVELLYTGPAAGTIRRTKQGLLEVVRSARSRLWVVSYILGMGADEVVVAMEERAAAGVDVKILVDHRTEGGPQSLARLAERAGGCRLFVWPDQHREIKPGIFANLHAKCAVADARRAFVSSANLTGWAMDYNLEVGYLVTGGASPRLLEDYFERLVDEGILEPYGADFGSGAG